ncbi:MAG: peptidoglycan DD-metalloendopeptidase family protein [Alphaproteobacteria bacterium]|nr:peptidoglycan DD-metalloendopeptidase family protein [Alphaproteobacteria bacterium]
MLAENQPAGFCVPAERALMRATGQRRKGRLGLKAAACAALIFATVPLHAQNETTDPLEKLDTIEKQLGNDRRSIESLTDDAAQLAREQQALRQKLIQAAGSAQARERDLNVVEQRLALFETREAAAMRALDGQRSQLSSLLAVLQRMGSEPPPALIVRPNDATAAARSAMLLSAVVPAVQKEAAKLAKDLADLRDLRQKAAEERMKVAAAAASLDKDRTMLSELLIHRRSLAAQTDQNLKETQARIGALAEQAGDLRALIASLNEDAKRPASRGSQVITNQIASAGAARNVSLDGLKGMLTLPANGELSARFGSSDEAGGHLAGIRVETRPGAPVTSPCDGKIMFAGTFRGYGQMLIIAANGGYHVLLAGLAKVDGVVGQTVLAGEPVGRMRIRPKNVQSVGGERLYIEFRRNGVPVDPAPWFAGLREKVSG